MGQHLNIFNTLLLLKFNKISVLLKARDRDSYIEREWERVGVWMTGRENYREARRIYRERVIESVGESVGYNKTRKSLQKEKV